MGHQKKKCIYIWKKNYFNTFQFVVLFKVANRGISPKTALKQWSCCHKTQSRSISISHVLKKDDNAEGSTMTIPEPPSLVPADALNSPSIVDATEVLDKVGVTLNAVSWICDSFQSCYYFLCLVCSVSKFVIYVSQKPIWPNPAWKSLINR